MNNDGLIEEVSWTYSIDGNKRIEGREFKRTVRLFVPLCLRPSFWKRNKYSLEDVYNTIRPFLPQTLWKYALLFGITSSNSTIKISFSSPESMIFGSRAIVIEKLMQVIKKRYRHVLNTKASILDITHLDHNPPIPVHHVSKSIFDKIHSLIRMDEHSFANNILREIHYQDYFTFNEVQMVPTEIEKDSILAIRIFNWDVYQKIRGIRGNALCYRPFDIRIKNQRYAGSCEEACLFKLIKN